MDEGDEGKRVQSAILVHLRQEFIAPCRAMIGYAEILLDEAKRLSFAPLMPDLERIHSAGNALHALLQSVLASDRSAAEAIPDPAKLRHDLRTPINAIKGYGEMLAEDAADGGHQALLPDLEKLLAAADGMLKQIDALVDFKALAPAATQAQPAADMTGAVKAVRAIRAAAADPIGAEVSGRILVVEDNASNRDLLSRQLVRAGHIVREAEGGHDAFAKLGGERFDLILLDLMMPDISGYEVLRRLKADAATRDIPVILISALDDIDSITRCIAAGAVDYLLKPFDPTLLRAKIRSSLENKILRDREKLMMEELQREKVRYEDLLLSILPRSVVDRINQGETMIADQVEEVTILFADIVNFTLIASQRSARDLVQFLNAIFSAFDGLSQRFGAEKIKTIGDAYMVAFGFPEARADHAEAAALLARAMLQEISRFRANDAPVDLRIGIHTGPAIVGVIGQQKFSFDVWGTTVNIASRMESLGEPGKVHVSEAFARLLADRYRFIERGTTDVKGGGMMKTFFLAGS
jgi:class 3 adenylate cyclase/CheY-like chemotaxis protein